MKRTLIIVALMLAGCSDDPGTKGDGSNNGINNGSNNGTNNGSNNGANNGANNGSNNGGSDAGADVGSVDMGMDPDMGPLGGDRPADVVVPSDWTASGTYPMVVLLHGYSANARVQNLYFRMGTLVDEYGFVLVLPNGTTDANGNRFWDATNACCDFGGRNPGDSEYLSELVTSAQARYGGDPKRTYFMGHSNGGFMSYRMACDHADQIAAVASLAGATWLDESACAPSEPVGVLQMHGTADATILFDGLANSYPSAQGTVDRWQTLDGCSGDAIDGGSFDLDNAVLGDETSVARWENCDSGVAIELWTMQDSGHIPNVDDTFTRKALDFLFAHQKP